MARATILSSLGGGLYRVRLHFDNSRVETRLTHMAAQISNYAAEIAALEPDKTEKTTALNTALTALNDYINATDPAVYVADPAELNALNKATWTARGELDVILHDEKLLKLKKASLEKETDQLNKFCPSDFETNAWCVDYVEDLSGETEAIECDYLLWRDVGDNQIEHDTGVWLPAATTPPTNTLIHPLASSEHATWFNLCMAPAAQRHAARYRIATISNLSGDTCDIEFDGRYDVIRANGNVIDSAPIHPQFAAGQKSTYTNANIVYGTCNGDVFQNGDRVIVDLHNGSGAPTVIGFYSNPRQCVVYPSIPWVTVSLKYKTGQLVNIFWSDYLSPVGTEPTPPGQSLGLVHGIDGGGMDVYFEFKIRHQQYISTLLDHDNVTPLGASDYYAYSVLYFSGSIPALVEVLSGFNIGFGLRKYKMVGGQIIDENTGIVFAVSYTIDYYPAPYYTAIMPPKTVQESVFTMGYVGPPVYTGGTFPPGSGSTAYEEKSTSSTSSPNIRNIVYKEV